MQLEEKLYTSTEVADVLGVSLRSVYRYLDEGKITAEVKTATGRHRFTKQNILDFLYPLGTDKQPLKMETVLQPVTRLKQRMEEPVIRQPQPQQTAPADEEAVDWLKKFREAAEKYRQEQDRATEVTGPASQPPQTISGLGDVQPEPKVEMPAPPQKFFYRSSVGGLKDIAQNIDKSARKLNTDYAFTLNAGLSLHKPIKPFSVLHVYVAPKDREMFERMLQLTTSDEANAQLCIVEASGQHVFSERREMHGLYVVSDLQLRRDLLDAGEEDLAREIS